MSQYTILYLDDEADNLLAFTAVFRRHYNVLTAQHATEAYDLLGQNHVQVVISDQRMPQITGVDFLSEVSQRYPEVIRMILTGYSDMQAIIDAINKGKIYYYITKPWKFDELKVIIDKAIHTFELRSENEKLINENHALVLKNLQQEKENISSRYEVLKNQINPHFLFNSLNTLASLISIDAPAALRFTTKFAKIYRLILEYGEQPLITLSQEMELLESYMFLQQLRFGKNLNIDINITDKNYVLPPFALQFLAENVIKHNIISEDKPMVIKLIQKGEYLEMKNRIHLKNSLEISTGIGLKNLSSRYFLLTNKEIKITNDGDFFIVNIPLIPLG
jgi:LytS/YehU family sensor histidine kinase